MLKLIKQLLEATVNKYEAGDKVDPRMPSRAYRPEHEVWPIPQFELDVNTELEQHALWQ